MKARVSLEKVMVVTMGLFVGLTFCQWPKQVAAQKLESDRTSKAPAAIKKENSGTSRTVPINAEYSAKIKEYTTQSYFSTELVDYLPASDKIPSPDRILGYTVGAP